MGLPRATDHVSQGGAKMAACTRLDLICCEVDGLDVEEIVVGACGIV